MSKNFWSSAPGKNESHLPDQTSGQANTPASEYVPTQDSNAPFLESVTLTPDRTPGQFAHSHAHTHSHAVALRKRLAIALSITGTFFLAELVGAALSNSLALLADAGHMAVDLVGLVIALIVSHLLTKQRCTRRTWGWARAEVLGSVLQATMLIVVCGAILWEAIHRFLEPTPVEGTLMITLGVLGLIANLLALLVLVGGRKNSLNLRAAVLEVATDALGSLAVIVAAIVYMLTDWMYADVVVSLFIAVLIVPRALVIMRESLQILLEETPADLDLEQVHKKLLKHPQVVSVHDLHASTIGTGLVNLTAHIVVTKEALNGVAYQSLMGDLQRSLKEDFPVSINHTTLQIDSESMAARELLAH